MSHYDDRDGGSPPYLGNPHLSPYQQAVAEGRIAGGRPQVSSSVWQPDQRNGALISDGNNGARTGRLWDGPPMINPNTGRPYRGCIIAMSRQGRQQAIVGFAHGSGVLDVRVGSVGGSIVTREVVVGSGGPPVYFEAGQYGHVSITLTTIFLPGGPTPASIQWTDGSALVAFDSPLMSPKILPGAALTAPAINAQVPEGAFMASFQNACTVTWDDGSGGAVGNFAEAVAAGGEVRVKGQAVNTDVNPGAVQYWLAPI